jgi:hypothetical protein
MAELALVLPMFMLVLLGVVDMSRVIWARTNLENAAREGARYAIVHGDSAGQICPAGPAEGKYVDLTSVPKAPATWTTCPYPTCPVSYRSGSVCTNYPITGSASYNFKQGVYNAAQKFVIAGGSGVTITACWGSGCSGNTDTTPSTTVRSTPVTVTVSSTLNLIVPSLLGWTSFSVVGTSTMLVNS